MNPELSNILACPECKSDLSFNSDKMKCKKCSLEYKIIEGRPVFIKKKLTKEEVSVGGFRDKLRKNPSFFRKFERIHHVVGPPDTTYSKQVKYLGTKIDRPLREVLISRKGKAVLNIGSSRTKAYKSSINLDIDLFDNVDVVADGKSLPFKKESFDIVIIEMVLEHVDEAEKVIREAYRVLKKKGLVYISIPFVFAFHGSPNDFNRYTINGLRRRLELSGFNVRKAGVLSGPSSTFSQILRYYLAMLFSFNSDFLFSALLNVFGWLTFWIKYLDVLMVKHKKAEIIASTIYAVGEK